MFKIKLTGKATNEEVLVRKNVKNLKNKKIRLKAKRDIPNAMKRVFPEEKRHIGVDTEQLGMRKIMHL